MRRLSSKCAGASSRHLLHRRPTASPPPGGRRSLLSPARSSRHRCARDAAHHADPGERKACAGRPGPRSGCSWNGSPWAAPPPCRRGCASWGERDTLPGGRDDERGFLADRVLRGAESTECAFEQLVRFLQAALIEAELAVVERGDPGPDHVPGCGGPSPSARPRPYVTASSHSRVEGEHGHERLSALTCIWRRPNSSKIGRASARKSCAEPLRSLPRAGGSDALAMGFTVVQPFRGEAASSAVSALSSIFP